MSISIGNSSAYIDTAQKTAAGSGLQKTLGKDLSTASEDELMDVCKDFEAYFVEQVMKEMKKMIPEDDNKDQSMGQLKDYFEDQMMQEYADKIVDQGDFGIAQTLYEQMKRNYNL